VGRWEEQRSTAGVNTKPNQALMPEMRMTGTAALGRASQGSRERGGERVER